MNAFYSFSLFLILSLFLGSCIKEVDFNSDIVEKKIVVNALCEINAPMTVYLERTVTLDNLEDTAIFISSGASITVTNNNTGQVVTVTTPSFDNCYVFPFYTAPNTSYTIVVEHPDYKTVSSTMTTGNNVNLISVDTASIYNNNYPMFEGTLHFQDPPEKNYYMVRVHTFMNDSNYFTSSTYGISTDPSIDNSLNIDLFGTPQGQEYYVFTDDLFNGEMKALELKSANPYTYASSNSTVQVTYDLITLNEDSYKYYKSLLVQYYSDPTFSEPAKLYTNILNGYGIFAPYYKETKIFH